jgi:hypothetical protein
VISDSSSPTKRQWIHAGRKFEQAGPRGRIKPFERMADRVAPDHAPLLHHGLARTQAALTVLEVDERQDARVGGGRLGAPAGEVMRKDDFDLVRQQRTGIGA